MKYHRFFITAASLLVAVFLMGRSVVLADNSSTNRLEVGANKGQLRFATDRDSAPLDYWQDCAAHFGSEILTSAERLCQIKDAGVDMRLYKAAKKLFAGAPKDMRALCSMDSVLVRTDQECSRPRQFSDVARSSSLIHRVAGYWRSFGNLDRAEQLYRRAIELSTVKGVQNPVTIFSLYSWVQLELQQDDLEGALELLQLSNEYYRGRLPASPRSARQLIAHLGFEGRILERLGRIAEVEAVLDEIDEISNLPVICEDYESGETPPPCKNADGSQYFRPIIRCELETNGTLYCWIEELY